MADWLNNKYLIWYIALVQRGQGRVKGEGLERHHIIPKSLNGDNSKPNLSHLTYREHFLAHWLLVKFTQGRDNHLMTFALGCMQQRNQYRPKLLPWQYEVAKQAHATSLNERVTSRKQLAHLRRLSNAQKGVSRPSHISAGLVGNKNSQGFFPSKETRAKQSNSRLGNKNALGFRHSETTKARISASLKEHYRA